MLIVHLVVGIIFGFVAAVWACSEGYSLLAMLGFYMLAGNLGVVVSGAVALVRAPRLAPQSAAPTMLLPS